MAALAETTQNIPYDQIAFETPALPLVQAVPEMAEDAAIRFRAARFIGACLVNEQVIAPISEANLTVQPIESLHDAVQKAAEGDEIARSMVETNVRTDVIERTIKAGHVIKVDLQVDEAGKIQQFGQSMESVQANSLRFAADNWQMRERTEAEAINAFRIEQLHKSGILQEHSFIVFSPAADNMTEKEMTDAGFFTDTMSCAIQVTSADGSELSTESAFVAGVKQAGGSRHDIDTIAHVAAKFGVDLRDKTAAEILGTPLLIHNSLIQNGAIDLVELFDEPNGTFFGQDLPAENYLEYLEKCKERERMLQPKVDAIAEELISEAPTITSRLAAVKRLHKLSEKHMVEQAAFDHEINPQVFGPEAAAHIEYARTQFAQGDYDQGLTALTQAKATARSSSCPTALKASIDGIDTAPEATDSKKESNADCEFVSKECPECHEKNVKTTVKALPSGKKIISGDCGCAVIR